MDYENLVYACSTCNRSKAAHLAPDTRARWLTEIVEVDEDGEIHPVGNGEDGITLIETIGLDGDDYNELRRLVFELRDVLPVGSKAYCRWFGFPKELPDLSKEPIPPRGNQRPKGVHNSSAFVAPVEIQLSA